MSEIVDELREFVKTKERYLYSASRSELLDLADRIDAEMTELPRDANNKPIHFDDTVFTKDDPGTSWDVRYIELRRDREPSIGIESNGVNTYRPPSWLTHERPDSWERIADELDEMVDAARSADDTCEKLADLADRIRKLAEREASNGTD